MTTDSAREAFPLLKTECQVAFIDDDPDYVEHLELFLPGMVSMKASFHTATDTLNLALERSTQAFDQEHKTLLGIARTQADRESGCPVSEPILRYFASGTRFEVIAVVVADHNMPGETGIELFSRITRPGLRRILLTGKADQQTAVDAFNSGSIDVYVPKQLDQVWKKVRSEIDAQMALSSDRRGQPLRDTLPSDLMAVLDVRECAHQVEGLLARERISEYMVVGRPYGIFGVRSDGSPVWVQLETLNSLRELTELLGEAGYEDEVLDRVRERKSLVALEWLTQLDQEVVEREAFVLGTEPLLVAAVFELANLRPDLQPACRALLPSRRAKEV